MEITFRPYSKEDIPVLTALWNEVLSDGVAFPGEVLYNEPDFSEYMGQQTAVNCMLADGKSLDIISCIRTISGGARMLRMHPI